MRKFREGGHVLFKREAAEEDLKRSWNMYCV